MRRVIILTIFILIAVISISVYQMVIPSEGIIEGKVSIGPWKPVELPGGGEPPPEVYTSRMLVLENSAFDRVTIPMNGTGYFHASVKAGKYQITMTNCTFLGCSRVFPKMVTIIAGQTTKIDIEVDTGIR